LKKQVAIVEKPIDLLIKVFTPPNYFENLFSSLRRYKSVTMMTENASYLMYAKTFSTTTSVWDELGQ
jgi:hypothetical protein